MPTSRSWPDYVTYRDAIQAPKVCFTDPRLRAADIRKDDNGIPLAATGKSAIVFRANAGSKDVALRCFTRGTPAQRSRYQALHAHIAPSSPPYFVDFTYRDREILVSGDRYPVVEMGWADGAPLNIWVKDHLQRSGDLAGMAVTWLYVVNDLRRRNMAHGDLANDNCLVSGSHLTLIDYDGCFIPALAAADPGEAGNQHFQHPQRMGYYAFNVDAFPSLVIYLSLRALSKDKTLWQFHNRENLIFAAADYRSPRTTPIWKALAKNRDPLVISLTTALADMCDAPINALPPLSHLVTQASIPAQQQRPWWQTWPPPTYAQKAVRDTQGQEPWWRSATLLSQGTGSTPAGPKAVSTSRLKDQLRSGPQQGSHHRSQSRSPSLAQPPGRPRRKRRAAAVGLTVTVTIVAFLLLAIFIFFVAFIAALSS